MRLFACIALPDHAVARVMSLRLRLEAPKDGLRWSPPEQWHITLQFFGEIQEDEAKAIRAALADLASPPLALRCERLAMFAAKGILLLDVEPSQELLALQQQVVSRTASGAALPESRPFHPHITLARSKGKTGYQTLQRLSEPALPSLGAPLRWDVDEVLLLESRLQRQGAEYHVLDRYTLRA